MSHDGHDRYHTWVHTAETVLLLGTGALAAVAILPHMGVPGWVLPAIEALTGLVVALSVWAASAAGRLSSYSAVLGAALAAWTVWAEMTRVWNVITVSLWIGGMIIFAPWGAHAVLAGRRPEPKAIEPKPDPDADKREEMARFETMFADAGQVGVQVLDLKAERAGRVLLLQLPRSGKVTMASLQGCAHSFEVSLQAQQGAVQFEIGSHSAEIIMRVRERNVFPEMAELREDLIAGTVNEPFAVGIQEDGTLLKIKLREIHMLIIGTTGSGKSNLINVLIAQLASCVDTVIWCIDMKGGRTARPWLQPWAEGRTEGPAIDWVATTRDEAALMVAAFKKAVETRMNSAVGGSKIVPSPSMPQIILLCDETSIILGDGKGTKKDLGEDAIWTNAKFEKEITETVQLARSEAAVSIFAAQRGTNDMIGSGTLKSLCKLRMALGAASENDYRWVIPDAEKMARQMSYMAGNPGVGVAAVNRNASQLTKFFWHDHIDGVCSEGDNDGCVKECPVYQRSIKVGYRRPALDRMTAGPLGEIYARRWERAGHLVRGTVPSGAATAVADVDITQFEEILRESGVKDEDAKVSPGRLRMRQILASRENKGATPKYLYDRLTLEGLAPQARETLQRWLKWDSELGILHSVEDEHGRWKYGPKPGGSRENAA